MQIDNRLLKQKVPLKLNNFNLLLFFYYCIDITLLLVFNIEVFQIKFS